MKMQDVILSFFDRVISFFFFLASLFLVFIMVAVMIEVVARYIFNRSQMWVIESCEYSMLYITFLGTAWLLKKKGHIAVDLLTSRLKPKSRALVDIINSIIGVFISVIITWYGILVTWDLFVKGTHTITALEPPLFPIMAVIPVGGFLLLIQFLRNTYSQVENFRDNSTPGAKALNGTNPI